MVSLALVPSFEDNISLNKRALTLSDKDLTSPGLERSPEELSEISSLIPPISVPTQASPHDQAATGFSSTSMPMDTKASSTAYSSVPIDRW